MPRSFARVRGALSSERGRRAANGLLVSLLLDLGAEVAMRGRRGPHTDARDDGRDQGLSQVVVATFHAFFAVSPNGLHSSWYGWSQRLKKLKGSEYIEEEQVFTQEQWSHALAKHARRSAIVVVVAKEGLESS